jgi:hypothetical protein
MLAHKAIQVGYYWPGMSKDSSEVVKHCNKCQGFDKVMTNPLEELSLVSALLPFVQWGIDLVGLPPVGKGGCKFVVVTVDYFTKWLEAEALATITTGNVRNFL